MLLRGLFNNRGLAIDGTDKIARYAAYVSSSSANKSAINTWTDVYLREKILFLVFCRRKFRRAFYNRLNGSLAVSRRWKIKYIIQDVGGYLALMQI